MSDGKEIGYRIRATRDRKGVSQKDLAKALRISASYLSQLEMGERNIDATLLYRIAVELKVRVERFYSDAEIDELHGKEIARFEHGGKTLIVSEA